jgi:hypothetical protein
MPTEYEPNQQLETLVAEVMNEPDFHSLVEHEVKVASCLKIKMNEDEEYVQSSGDAAQLKKVGPPFTAFIDQNFILVFDAYAWNNFPQRRSAAIHKALMRVKLKITDSGDIKLGTRAPDVQEFTATLRRYGAYNDELTALMRAAEDVSRLLQ